MTVQIGVAYFRLTRFGRVNEMSFILHRFDQHSDGGEECPDGRVPCSSDRWCCRHFTQGVLEPPSTSVEFYKYFNGLVIHENCGL